MTDAKHSMWGGRFAHGPDALFSALNNSLPVDWRLVHEDITGSIAWAGALSRADVLSHDECKKITRALQQLKQTVSPDSFPTENADAEDVHTWVELQLIKSLGDLGKKLHTGRSRNDQVVTDFRLWTRSAIDQLATQTCSLRHALATVAKREADTVFPGYTHLQRAQPITFGHWALAYESMFSRDCDRLVDARKRVNVCPLGSAALAGTTFPIDREQLAADLEFEKPTSNSLDAVSDRDFVLETLSAMELIALHLSRMAEDLIIYSSQEFGLIEMDDRVTSGSSIMPQKKNPDAMELVRACAGRIMGLRMSLATAIKGLPLAYNKDLQDDKRTLFDAFDHITLCVSLSALTIATLTVNHDRAATAAIGGFANATELADALVGAGVPFRTAHDQVGALVRACIDRNTAIEHLPLEEMRQWCPQSPSNIHELLTGSAAVSRRDIVGATAPHRVLAAAQHVLATLNRTSDTA
ncbi:MAG: argininosuccinate lyase [Phycisphaeraceae bacterium]|nr:argininosuccinate lyase [Phycisphaerales bacterium]MCB9860729.1 argininosuccinate lyase [Phycisphaeraceae bacterium]